jgi:hypothetical protein
VLVGGAEGAQAELDVADDRRLAPGDGGEEEERASAQDVARRARAGERGRFSGREHLLEAADGDCARHGRGARDAEP